jgi:uncharacterized membrane protein
VRILNLLWQTLLKGLAVVLPIAATVWLTYWLLAGSEKAMHELLKWIFPGEGDPPYYFYGMGILVALALIFIVGLLMQAYLFRMLFKLMDYLFNKIPLLRSIYGGLKDVADMLANQDQKKKLNSAVVVELNEDMRLLGLITRDDLKDLPEGMDDETGEGVAVYLPMSYQVGGFTLFMPRSKLQPVDIPVDEALRFALTAGMSAQVEPGEDEKPKPPSTITQLKLKEQLRHSRRVQVGSRLGPSKDEEADEKQNG